MDIEDQDDIYTDGGVRGDHLHRRRDGAEVFYIHRYQVVAFLLFRFSSLQSRVVQSGVGSGCVCLNTGISVLVDCKFGSKAVDEGDSGGRLQGQQQDQPHRRQTILE